MPINQIELVICDVIPIEQNLTFDKEKINKVCFKDTYFSKKNFNFNFKLKNSKELRTRIFSCKAGQYLPLKIINLVQNFYELAVTSVTNIPMKVNDTYQRLF